MTGLGESPVLPIEIGITLGGLMGRVIDSENLFKKKRELNEFLQENPQYKELYAKIEDKLPKDADQKLALLKQIREKHMEMLGGVFQNLRSASQELSENLQKLADVLEERKAQLQKLHKIQSTSSGEDSKD